MTRIGPMHRRSVAEVDTFITMLRTACVDRTINDRLQRLLSLPDAERQTLIHTWVTDLMVAGAPRDFIEAIACLLDNQVAEKAYEVIYDCRRDATARHVESRAWKISVGCLAVALPIALAWIFLFPARTTTRGSNPLSATQLYANSVSAQIRQAVSHFPEVRKHSARSTRVLLRINRSGEIEQVGLVNSSGDATFDELSLLIAMKAGPFPWPLELRERMNKLKADYITLEHTISNE